MNERKCHKCGGKMNSWDVKLSKAFKTYDTCEKCFCEIYDMDKDDFRARMSRYFGIRPCTRGVFE